MHRIGAHLKLEKNGVSKRVLVIRGAEESEFEEAIFILKEDAGLSDDEFLREAETLAGDFADDLPPRDHRLLPFGFALVSLLLVASWLFFLLFL